jgi:hypothetical protein
MNKTKIHTNMISVTVTEIQTQVQKSHDYPNLLFYPMCSIEMLHFINSQISK